MMEMGILRKAEVLKEFQDRATDRHLEMANGSP